MYYHTGLATRAVGTHTPGGSILERTSVIGGWASELLERTDVDDFPVDKRHGYKQPPQMYFYFHV